MLLPPRLGVRQVPLARALPIVQHSRQLAAEVVQLGQAVDVVALSASAAAAPAVAAHSAVARAAAAAEARPAAAAAATVP